MRQSIKTRLLSASYKAACALAEKVVALTESIRENKDGSYLDDLYDHRDALAEELREGNALLGALERHLDNVQEDLEITNRELNGDYPLPRALADFDALTELPLVDEDEAPLRFKAVASAGGCVGCFFCYGTCPDNNGGLVCIPEGRDDEQNVIFVKR